MRRRWSELGLLVLLSTPACSHRDEAPEPVPVCEAPGEPDAPPPDASEACAPRGPDEWADAPADVPFLLPYRLELSPDETFAEAIFVAGPPEPRRYTYRLDLEDGTVMPMAVETLGEEWADGFWSELERIGLDSYLLCEVLRDGTSVRLLPARPGGEPVVGRFYGDAYRGAIRRRGADGTELGAYAVWVPEPSEDGRRCGERLLRWPDGRMNLLCLPSNGVDVRQCPYDCLGNTDESTPWKCTGRTPGGLPFCEPP